MVDYVTGLHLFSVCLAAGILAPMIGLGGGFILVPLLSLFFGLPMIEAVATSLVCIVATSQAFALAKRSSENTDIRVGMFLEIFTVCGVILGGVIATSIDERLLKIIFGLSLLIIFFIMLKRIFQDRKMKESNTATPKNTGSKKFILAPLGSFLGGITSGMLGVGGGVIKVPVLRLLMGVDFRKAAATSNFMIGITAAAGAIFYLVKGHVSLSAAIPCILGISLGAYIAGRAGHKVNSKFLEILFLAVLAYFAVKMFLQVL